MVGKRREKKITALLLVFLEIFPLFCMANVQSKVWTKGKVILSPSVRLHHCLEKRPEFLPRKPALGFINSLPNSDYGEDFKWVKLART